MPVDIQVVIGEGERDKAPRLFTGEMLGDQSSQFKIDVAVDPLEGTNLCAQNKPGSLAVMSLSLRGELFKAPDIYMKKIACGPKAKGKIDLAKDTKTNILNVAKALGKLPKDITVGVLKRDRHKTLIEEIKATKASVHLVDDGDVALALATALEDFQMDLLMGTGGAPEGVLAASALKCLDGDFQGQLVYKDEEERQRAKKAGVKDLDKILKRDEMVSGDCFFYATGVTKGPLLEGIVSSEHYWETHSLVLGNNFSKKIHTKYSK